MKVALIAGQGLLPVEAAKVFSGSGSDLTVLTFSEAYSMDFSPYTSNIPVFGMGQVGKVLKFLKNLKPDKLLFAGKFDKSLLENNLKLDIKALWMLATLKDRQEDTIMHALCAEIEKLGIQIMSQIEVFSHLVVPNGIHTRRKPSRKEIEDIRFAYKKAKGIAGLDIGQSVVVKNKTVLSIESIEGTNQVIERGASFCHGGFTFMKVAKPDQDYRFDLPVIGEETLEQFRSCNGKVFAVEGGSTLAVDFAKCVEFADKNNFSIVGYG